MSSAAMSADAASARQPGRSVARLADRGGRHDERAASRGISFRDHGSRPLPCCARRTVRSDGGSGAAGRATHYDVLDDAIPGVGRQPPLPAGCAARPARPGHAVAARSGAGPARCWSPRSARYLRFDRLSDAARRHLRRDVLRARRAGHPPVRRRAQLRQQRATACWCAATRTFSPTAASSWCTHRSARCSSPRGSGLFGLTPFGWRFAVAVVGSLSILLLARIARRMTRSTLLGCVAGLLLALDGLEFVMSRTALLDIFVMFWVLAAFGCLVVDRDVTRARLVSAAQASPAGPPGTRGNRPGRGAPRTARGVRWWRIGAGVCLGLASPPNGTHVVRARFAALVFAWDVGARRTAGLGGYGPGTARLSRWLPAWFGALPLVVYLATWSRLVRDQHPVTTGTGRIDGVHVPVISPLSRRSAVPASDAAASTLGLQTHHPYQSQPWTWLTMSRPVSFFWSCPQSGTHGCAAAGRSAPRCSPSAHRCSGGRPSWPCWCACGWWLTRRDWRAGAVLVGVAVGWLPWFWFAVHDHRTEFLFYAVEFVPFLVIAIMLCLGLVIGSAHGERHPPHGGRVRGRCLRARGAAELRVPVPVGDRADHSVHVLAVAHVVPRLDLRARPV